MWSPVGTDGGNPEQIRRLEFSAGRIPVRWRSFWVAETRVKGCHGSRHHGYLASIGALSADDDVTRTKLTAGDANASPAAIHIEPRVLLIAVRCAHQIGDEVRAVRCAEAGDRVPPSGRRITDDARVGRVVAGRDVEE